MILFTRPKKLLFFLLVSSLTFFRKRVSNVELSPGQEDGGEESALSPGQEDGGEESALRPEQEEGGHE